MYCHQHQHILEILRANASAHESYHDHLQHKLISKYLNRDRRVYAMLWTFPVQQCPSIYIKNHKNYQNIPFNCDKIHWLQNTHCSVYRSPSISMSLFKNSTPIVWNEFSSNWFDIKRFIRQLFPTPPSPTSRKNLVEKETRRKFNPINELLR